MASRLAAWWSLRRQRLHAARIARGAERVPLAIRLIAAGKLAKALGFIVIGLVLGRLVHAPDAHAWVLAALERVHIDPDGARAQRVLAWVAGQSHGTIVAAGYGAFLYAAVYLVEGLGLWFDRRWAEWLTAVATAALIPLEIVHLVHKPSPGIALVLLLNLAVVAYLAHRLRRHGRPSTTGTP